MPDEERFVSETGGAKGRKLARFDLLPPASMWALAEHYGKGARKYTDRNWEKGYPWSLNFAAMQRHLWSWWSGETDDPENGSSHLVAAAWHCFALIEFAKSHPEFDDRPKGEE